MHRGRPPVTRARVLRYWREHGPCTIGQVCRATGADRSHIYRILKGEYGLDFRLCATLGAETGLEVTGLPLAA